MEGAHSRVEASIASPTSPPYVAKQLMTLFHVHTTTVQLLWVLECSTVVATNDILRILVKAQPSTQSTWPRSPTKARHTAARPGPTQ